jgi:two-component system sensor histidine kinase BaeS
MQLEMGQPLALERRPTDLVALVRRMVDHQREIAEHPIRVEASVGTLVCEVDAERIERVVGNLIANASKYSPESADVSVRVVAAQEGEEAWAVLTVADQGRGVPAEDLPHVVDRFYRAENVGRTQGAGIGLASVREIVEQHGGTVAIESSEGTGTVVTVRLRLAEALGS